MRRLVIFACVLALPCAAWARSGRSATSWDNLAALHAGEKIQVVDTSHKKHSGAFVSFSRQAITMEEKHKTETIQRGDVANVSISGRHRLRNALIGGLIGGGAGAGIGAAAWSSGHIGTSKGEFAAILGAVGFVGGAVVGALLPDRKTVYRENP